MALPRRDVGGSGAGRWLFWPYRAALRLLPVRLRREHGQEMLEHHCRLVGEGLHRAGLAAAAWLALLDSADVVLTAVRERLGAIRHRRGAGGNSIGFGIEGRRRMDRLWQDIRFTIRSWQRSPGFAMVSVATLALAIGANTSIFTVVDAVMLEPLPYRSSGDLVRISQTLPQIGWDRGPVSYPNFEDWRRDARSLSDMAAFRTRIRRTLTGGGEAEQVEGSEATPNLFGLLGVSALRGRTFTDADASSDARVILLGESMWRRRYGASPDVVGTTITLSGEPYTVVGIMPSWFDFPNRQDEYWMPLPAGGPREDRDTNYLQVIGRLAPGSTLADARREMQTMFDRMRAEYPAIFGTNQPNVEGLREYVSGNIRPTLAILTLAVGLLLLVACANLANLVLIRATGRGHELAVRSALGAERGRVVRQLVTESSLLALAGGVLGAGVAVAGTRLLLTLGPQTLPRRQAIGVDGRALVFTLAISVLTALLFGVLPALRIARRDAHTGLRESARGGSGRGAGRAQRLLVVVQVALAFVLLTGGALLVNSFARLTGSPSGLDPTNVLSAQLSPPGDRYGEYAQRRAFFDDVLERIEALPGVTSVGATWALPFSGGFASGRIVPEGATVPAGEEPLIGLYPVLGDYFETMRIPLLAGRLLRPGDVAGAPTVVVINEAAAERLWPGQDPIGKRFRRGSVDEVGSAPWITVVGVVASSKRADLGEPVAMESYWSQAQAQWAAEMYIVARSAGDPLALAEPMRGVVRSVDADVPLTNVRTMADRISVSVAQPRFRTFIVVSFAVLGAILALVGIYGVMAFTVVQRTREIGVRMALGARRSTVLRDVFADGAKLIGAGLFIGAAGALAASRVVSGLLFEITPFDLPTWIAVATLLTTGAALACLVPAGRASRVPPLIALRTD